MDKQRLINFPPGAEAGDPYSIWVFDGTVWMLDPDQSQTSVRWEDLVDKPQQIDALGIDNEVSSGAYIAEPGKAKPEAFWSEKKL